MARLVVDGMNVIGSRPDGWWRDRDGAVRRLVGRLGRLAEAGEDVTVVFDGRPPADLAEGAHSGVAVLYARRPGRDAADDRVVEVVGRATEAPGAEAEPLRVVTSDRRLGRRVRDLGAEVVGAGALLARLDATG